MRCVVIGTVLVLAVTGCSPAPPPPSYTDEERTEFFEKRLDAAWANTGLEGVVDRPDLAAGIGDRYAADNWFSLSTCMFDTGLDGWGLGESRGGPRFTGASNDELPPEQQLAAYRCFAQYPVTDSFRNVLLTDDQKQYLYDYYRRWVVPCLRTHRYEINLAFFPTEALLIESIGEWNPYDVIVGGPNFSPETGLSEDALAQLHELCGSPSADLDVDLTQQFGLGG